jgi:tRNA nucleotidyltransferase (CCA-adding enzyme)
LNIRKNFGAAVSPSIASATAAISEVAARVGDPLFLVGGAVRDSLLGREVKEVDFVFVGDVAHLASEVERSGLGRQVASSQFLTAKLQVGDSVFDIVTARGESYKRPGALPTVHRGDLQADLARRDFTVNAMAVSLTPGTGYMTLIDPLRGQVDLEDRVLRALHPSSFRDDATRVFRAARYASRLGFRVDPATAEWIGQDGHHLDAISPDRLRHEFDRCWDEPAPERVLELLDAWGALTAVHEALSWTRETSKGFGLARTSRPSDVPRDSVYWAAMGMHAIVPHDADGLAARLNLQSDDARAFFDGRSWSTSPGSRLQMLLDSGVAPSEIVHLLDEVELPVVIAAAAVAVGPPAAALSTYIEKLRLTRPFLNGDDLIEMGVAEGPLIGDLLRRLRTTRIDGESTSAADERSLVFKWTERSDNYEGEKLRSPPADSALRLSRWNRMSCT